eukprot:CAMPEP_0204038310 /NCGR_PEP_ID=MMETSP0360-20130528/86905_1 /ASSEMBLY_ACC=CAM_ASM_000342 /TAXON_ID=268821 /ORGANISM="Scrippsiella Hangoei, Strain SHTV-5" /LENGTH=77 /DNA_ID=CAMNT_0050983959 /DNA_START=8 /DNA_END=238 /DNA_ORIENTATION=-
MTDIGGPVLHEAKLESTSMPSSGSNRRADVRHPPERHTEDSERRTPQLHEHRRATIKSPPMAAYVTIIATREGSGLE